MAQKGSGLIKAAFDTDNFLMRFSEKVLDIVTVNLLFVVSCLPIVTIGIARLVFTKQFLKLRKVDEFQYLKAILEPLNKI